jgi:uncharacterized membrane protein YdjX (TVP38/TMEM64 family)
MDEEQTVSESPERRTLRTWLRSTRREQVQWVLVIVAGLAVGAVIFKYRAPILALASNPEQVRGWVETLGPLGPLGLIALNALQVVVAFVPGPVVQVVAGYLFGWFQGAILGLVGMIIGGTLAVLLARIFGRPLVRRIVGEQRLARWEQVAHLNSLPIWFILMLGPFGDIPYYIAGLTSLAIWKIIAVAVFVRTPSIIVATAIGAGVIERDSPLVIGAVVLLVIAALVGIRYQAQIEQWVDQNLLQRVARRLGRNPAGQPGPLLLPAPLDEVGQPDETNAAQIVNESP